MVEIVALNGMMAALKIAGDLIKLQTASEQTPLRAIPPILKRLLDSRMKFIPWKIKWML